MKITTSKLEFCPLDRVMMDFSPSPRVYFNNKEIPIIPSGEATVAALREALADNAKDYTIWRENPDPRGPDFPQSASALLIDGARYYSLPGAMTRRK